MLRAHLLGGSRRRAIGRSAAVMAVVVGMASPRASAQPPAVEEAASRILHRFDFTEPNNFDDVPQDWVRFPDRAFLDPALPRYTEGRFDKEVGHSAPPSFYLDGKGRSVAFRYVGEATRIRPADFLVVGYVRPNRLRTGRAVLSAYFLDWQGRYIADSQRFSRMISEADASEEPWQRLQVYLPKAPAEAQYVGLTCWVVQEEVWRSGPLPHRHILERDMEGGAWFDDIVLLELPRAELSLHQAGNVVELPEEARLIAHVTDDEGGGLTAELIVHDQDGGVVFAAPAPVQRGDESRPVEFRLSDLQPGLYHAKLGVQSLGEPLLERTLTFAVVAKRRRARGVISRQMGMIVEEAQAGAAEDVIELIRASGVGMCKLPLWSADPVRPAFDAQPDALHRVLDRLIEARVTVIGTFAGPPTALRQSAGPYARTLLDILGDDARGWNAHLDAVVAPYASIFRSWQIGGDDHPELESDPRLPGALDAVRQALRTMITAPNLTTVASAGTLPQKGRFPAENLSVVLPADVDPAFVGGHLAAYRSLGYQKLWVTAPAPQVDGYEASAALARWTRMLIEMRWADVDAVFAPQLWKTRTTLRGQVTEPTPAYLIFRTLADTLAELRPVRRFRIEGGAEGAAFGDGRRSVLVLWQSDAPPEGVLRTMQLGAVEQAFDVWGRPVELQHSADGRQQIRVGRMPVFVPDVEQWLVEFRAGVQISPPTLGFSFEPQPHELTITNPSEAALSGQVVLQAPPNWELAPASLRFSLAAGESRTFPLLVRYPSNESAGDKLILAKVELQSGRGYQLEIPLELALRLEDVEVWGYAVVEGERLLVRHGLTNRSTVPLSFQAFAVFPGRSRQYRVINELLPGQSLTAEYRFEDAALVAGRSIRLGLREVNGPRLHNLEIAVP